MNPPRIAANPGQMNRLQIAGNTGLMYESGLPVNPGSCKRPLRTRLHEPGLAANPGQVADPDPLFSSQTLVQLNAFD